MSGKPVFKPYDQNQRRIIFGFEDMIPEGHMVRVISQAVDQMDLTRLLSRYPGGGTSSYHPAMLLKVLFYAYADHIYSSRRIAKASRENIHFLWLTGNTPLDHMTINRFRGERMNGIIEEIFAEVLELLATQGYVKLEEYFMDGTKIEANAGKYSWVWGKSTKRYKAGLQEKCRKLFEEIDEIDKEEKEKYGDRDLEETGNGKEIDSEAIREAAKRIDEKLNEKPKDRQRKKAKRKMEKDYLPRMEKYEQQEKILEKRKSYSKTDTDATFMRMKEDHMKNGQLKPGYNVQIGTENQFVTGFSIHQRPGDTSCMKEHLEAVKRQQGSYPNNVIADAGYGSEENYEHLKKKGMTGFVKYNTFHKEATKKWKLDITKVQNYPYVKESDEYRCPMGRCFHFLYEKKEKSENGYESKVRVYECESCKGCEHRERCITSKKEDGNRRIYINERRNELRKEARELLTSEKGLEMRSRRPIEVESVFGDIKGNYGVRRFLLRGLEKVTIEWGLLCIGHNMRKMMKLLNQPGV